MALFYERREIPAQANQTFLPLFGFIRGYDGESLQITANEQAVSFSLQHESLLSVLDVSLHSGTERVEVKILADDAVIFSKAIELSRESHERARTTGAAREHKRKLLDTILACPTCLSPLSSTDDDCKVCGTTFHRGTRAVSMVPISLPEPPHASDASFCLFGEQERTVIDEIRRRDGLVLDLGAGLQPESSPNVVNLEISDLPSTDVIAMTDRLPFRSNSFDAVVSLHVFEHLEKPWLMAQEVQRVLKVGGVATITAPYICAVHGFPSHFFNPTPTGLRTLFNPMEVVSHEIKGDGHPFNGVQQIIGPYLQNLPPSARARMMDMTIRELIEFPLPEALRQDFCRDLSESGLWIAPAHTTLTVRKIVESQ